MHNSFIEVSRYIFSMLIFPQICIVCGEKADTGKPLCTICLELHFLKTARNLSFLKNDPERCHKCGRTLISALDLCTVCRNKEMYAAIDRIIPIFPYTAKGQELLTTWKIAGMRGLSIVFAQCIAAVLLNTCFTENLTIIPVPPRPDKIKIKGWDQVEELVKILEKYYKINILRCLARNNSMEQKKLNRLARGKNLKGHIIFDKSVTLPDTVIVLDDLMTTGSTLDTCADILKTAGCRKVYGLTLFFD